MNQTVLSALIPVVLLIAVGYLAGRRGWVGATAVKDLSNLVFLVLAPALLFRTMSSVHVEQVDFWPLAAYFLAAFAIFFGMLALWGLNRRNAVLALAATFSNTAMIGVPLVGLAFGQAGLVPLFTLISVHALVMLTITTVVLELAVIREARAAGQGSERHMGRAVLLAVRNAVIHPVPLPILAGLAFAQTGLSLPQVVDKPLQMLGTAFGPLALVLVGVTLAATPIGTHWRGALGLALTKNFVHPLLVLAIGWALGLKGVSWVVMMVASSLPIGANVFLFSQRYEVEQDLVTTAVALSTLTGLLSVSLLMAWAGSAGWLAP